MAAFVQKSDTAEPYTAWFQGHQCGSWFHLVRAGQVWDGWLTTTACGRRINQYDQWERPGVPGHEYGTSDQYTCPKCMRILEREDPARYQQSLTYMPKLYAWMAAYRPNNPAAQGPKPWLP